jgi:putative urate catabolism protein
MRDLLGHGRTPPHARWPGGARLAVQFVLNVEEGGEHNVLYGDEHSEAFLTEEPTTPLTGRRNLNVESQYEYGSRAGFWRLHRLFTDRGLPLTVFGIARALEQAPDAVAAMGEAGWEIACHGLRWIDYSTMGEEEERRHVREAIEVHTGVTGQRPEGWYTGRTSPHTRRIVAAEGGFLYDSDSFADDLPYWVPVDGTPQLVVPYTLDNNDIRFLNPYGYNAPSFADYLIGAFDLLVAEGADRPKMMSIGMHSRIVGRPGRAADLVRFLDHVAASDAVWVARRADIARHWRAEHPAGQPEVTP